MRLHRYALTKEQWERLMEGRRRNLLPNEKGPAMTPGQSTTGRKT
jgi:hypothetical protein